MISPIGEIVQVEVRLDARQGLQSLSAAAASDKAALLLPCFGFSFFYGMQLWQIPWPRRSSDTDTERAQIQIRTAVAVCAFKWKIF